MAIGQGAISEAQAFGASMARTTVEFNGTAGKGQAATAVPLFTVTVTDGTLVVACFWTPLTADGYVVGV
jgi:hypothetical protein